MLSFFSYLKAPLSFTVATMSLLSCDGDKAKGGGESSTPSPVISGDYAYITNSGANTVTFCAVGADGTMSSCKDTGGTAFSTPRGIVINNKYAYVTNFGNSTVTFCAVGADGTFSACTATGGASFGKPSGIVLSGSYAYINTDTTMRSQKPIVCDVSTTDGSLSGCSTARSVHNYAYSTGVAIAGNWFFIIGNPYTLYYAPINSSTGNLGSGPSTAYVAGVPTDGIAFNSSNTFVYLTKATTIQFCAVSLPTLSACASSGAVNATKPFVQTSGIALNNGFAYITDRSSGAVQFCAVNATTGVLTGCAVTGDTPFSAPWGIAIATF